MELIADISQAVMHLPAAERLLIFDCIWFLLDNQYVYDAQRDLYFKVVEGTGQGLRCSGEIAGLAYFGRIELKLLSPRAMQSSGVLYVQFRDDVLCVCRTAWHTTLVYNFCAKNSCYFTVKL